MKNLAIKFDVWVFDSQIIFLASSNVLYANNSLIRYSSQGYAFNLFNNIIDWKTIKQKTMTTNSIEVELLAISTTEKELI